MLIDMCDDQWALVAQYKFMERWEAELEVMGATAESNLPFIAAEYQRQTGSPIETAPTF